MIIFNTDIVDDSFPTMKGEETKFHGHFCMFFEFLLQLPIYNTQKYEACLQCNVNVLSYMPYCE